MANDFDGTRVLITAAAAGLGRAMALAFHDQGAKVHVCDIDSGALEALAAEAPAIGCTLADVSDVAAVDRLFDEALGSLGGLDVLVNNAGIAGPTASIEDIDPADWDRTISVGLNGQFYCARRAVPALKAAGGGSIVNISSSAGIMGYPQRTPYAAAKWGVVGLTKSLAMEQGEFGIRVNAICPGAVEGDRIDGVIAAEARATGVDDDFVRDRYTRQTSLRTFVTADDIAAMVLFICSAAGARITGQALAVDGHTETLKKH